jgi:hypothetical protein
MDNESGGVQLTLEQRVLVLEVLLQETLMGGYRLLPERRGRWRGQYT